MPDPAANELAADTRRKTLCPMMVLAHRSGPLKTEIALGTKYIAVEACDPLPSPGADIEVTDRGLDVF